MVNIIWVKWILQSFGGCNNNIYKDKKIRVNFFVSIQQGLVKREMSDLISLSTFQRKFCWFQKGLSLSWVKVGLNSDKWMLSRDFLSRSALLISQFLHRLAFEEASLKGEATELVSLSSGLICFTFTFADSSEMFLIFHC